MFCHGSGWAYAPELVVLESHERLGSCHIPGSLHEECRVILLERGFQILDDYLVIAESP